MCFDVDHRVSLSYGGREGGRERQVRTDLNSHSRSQQKPSAMWLSVLFLFSVKQFYLFGSNELF